MTIYYIKKKNTHVKALKQDIEGARNLKIIFQKGKSLQLIMQLLAPGQGKKVNTSTNHIMIH